MLNNNLVLVTGLAAALVAHTSMTLDVVGLKGAVMSCADGTTYPAETLSARCKSDADCKKKVQLFGLKFTFSATEVANGQVKVDLGDGQTCTTAADSVRLVGKSARSDVGVEEEGVCREHGGLGARKCKKL